MSNYKGFSTVELSRPTRSRFDLSHERRMSTRMGKLTPVFISETLPNDTFNVNTEVLLRLAPLLAPIMHRVNVFVHFFFVPNRLLWEDWEEFITAGRLGEDSPVPPRAGWFNTLDEGANLLDKGSLADYLGIPNIPDADVDDWEPGVNDPGFFDLMPFASYYKVWYDYYRDRNFVADNENLPLTSGTQSGIVPELLAIKNRSWQHDYFTSALPWTQRGAEVLMPLEGTGTVNYLGTSIVKTTAGANVTSNTLLGTMVSGAPGTLIIDKDNAADPGNTGRIENISDVDITNSNVSINDLRRAVRLQEWLERNALAGSRYNESIMAHFGRKTSDARLQRAEYLGGGKVVVKINEVVTTAYSQDATDTTVPPANMSGHGISFGETNRFSYNCEEHGFVIGIMSVMPTSGYMQGLPRMFSNRSTFLDYPWPSFAHLGEQEVYNSEIFLDPATAKQLTSGAQSLFGYQSRYSDWKHISSSSHGDFRSSLDFWHLTRKFEDLPVLGAEFNTFEDELQDRIFAVSGVDTLWCYIYNDISVKRSLPYFGTPKL